MLLHRNLPGFPFCTVAFKYLKTSLLYPCPFPPFDPSLKFRTISKPTTRSWIPPEATDELSDCFLSISGAGPDQCTLTGWGLPFRRSHTRSTLTKFLVTQTSEICLENVCLGRAPPPGAGQGALYLLNYSCIKAGVSVTTAGCKCGQSKIDLLYFCPPGR